MPQLFSRKSNALAKLSIFVALVGLVAIFMASEAFMWSSYETEVGVPVSQPVPFSHIHHVGELNIDCRFCHAMAENSPIAGMPSSDTCMSCHSQIWNDAPMLKAVRDSFATKEPIAWNQVNRIAKFVYFDHSIHIKKGIGCSSCHGHIDRMPLTEKARTFYMRDCLSCHREPEENLRPPEHIFDPEYQYPENQFSLGKELLHKYNIHKESLTDCYSCHR